MANDAPTAFFSYSRDDSEFALRLAEDLKAAGANVWLDQLDIQPGQRWARAVQDALNNSPRVLVILSPSSVSSTNVDDEVNFALEERKTIIPVLYRDCKVPFQLRPFQYVDLRTDYARGLKVMLKTLGVEHQAAAEPGPLVGERQQSREHAQTLPVASGVFSPSVRKLLSSARMKITLATCAILLAALVLYETTRPNQLAPAIIGLMPSTGGPNTPFTIAGLNFGFIQGPSVVRFGSSRAMTVTSWSANSITANVPDNVPVGYTNVIVSVGGIDSDPATFTVKPSTPKLSVTKGSRGTSVTITGTNYTNYGDTQGSSTIRFGAAQATLTSWSATAITVTVPDKAVNDASGTTNVVVTVNGIDSDPATFAVQ